MPEKSFLGTVKDELNAHFAETFNLIAGDARDEENVTKEMVALRNKVWQTVEAALKTSYRNGQKSKENGKPPIPSDTPPDTKINPFRKS